MRVCHVASGHLRGGAARGALWLHRALLLHGVDSLLVTNDRAGAEGVDGVIERAPLLPRRLANRLAWYRDQLPLRKYPGRESHLFSPGVSGADAASIAKWLSADILHLHWICGGFIDIRTLSKVEIPVVWTLRDLWPLTGGCHYPSTVDCDRFTTSCGTCPHLGSTDKQDLSARIMQTKACSLPRHLSLIAPSSWVKEQIHRSSLHGRRQVHLISNCIDTDVFAPMDVRTARAELGLDPEANVVAVGASDLADIYKGRALLANALLRLPNKTVVLTFGKTGFKVEELPGKSCVNVGWIHSDAKLRYVYASADVFVSASTVETFGKTLAEAQACGTPVVASATSGALDIVNHRMDGWLAAPGDAEAIAEGIGWVLEHPSRESLRLLARRNACERFSMRVIASKHEELYDRIMREPIPAKIRPPSPPPECGRAP